MSAKKKYLLSYSLSGRKTNIVVAILFVLFAFFGLLTIRQSYSTSAAPCGNEPTSTTGRSSQTITIPSTDTYTIWSRLKAPDINPVQYEAYIDGECFTIGQTALSAGVYEWVDYENGVVGDKATIDLAAGEYTLVLTAGTDQLELDRVMLLSDSCTPTATGANCEPDTTDPVTSVTAPTDSSTVSGNVPITASASDNDAVDRVEFYLDGALLGSDTTAPYSYSWDSTSVLNGSYDISSRAYDDSGNNVDSTDVSITVANPVPAVISSFSASPTQVTSGSLSTLSWNITSGQNCSIDNSVGAVAVGSGSTSVNPTVNTTYTLSCNGINGGAGGVDTATITINPAADSTPPVITLTGSSSVTHEAGTIYIDAGATALDDIDGDITGNIVVGGSVNSSIPSSYQLTYDVQDANGNNATQVTRDITVVDTQAPTLSYSGTSPYVITEGAPFDRVSEIDGNVTAYDTLDGDITGDIVNSGDAVNTAIPGDYTLRYNVQDVAGNSSTELTITVRVSADTDSDGIRDSVEAAGPNSGDANYDSILDATQPNVASLLNTKNGQYNVLEIGGDCNDLAFVSSGQGGENFVVGSYSFSVNCSSPSDIADVRIILDDEYDFSKWSVYKINDSNDLVSDMSSIVDVTNETIGPNSRTTLTYQIEDGSSLDEDGLLNGVIVDPVAVIQDVAAASTDDTGDLDAASEGLLEETGRAVLVAVGVSVFLILSTIVTTKITSKMYKLER